MKKYLVLTSFILFLVIGFIAYCSQDAFFQHFLINISTTFFSVSIAILVIHIYLEKNKRKVAIASLFNLANDSMVEYHNYFLDLVLTQFGRTEYFDILGSYLKSDHDIKVLKPNDRKKLFNVLKDKKEVFLNYFNELENALLELSTLVGWDLDTDLLMFILDARQSIRNFRNIHLVDTTESENSYISALLQIDLRVEYVRGRLIELGKIEID